MNEAAALAELTLMVAASEEPTLDSDDLASVLKYARRPDADGLVYSDDDWTPTWDLSAAASEGWLRKASKAAGRFSFAEDGQRFDRAQVYAHCVAQHQHYANRVMGSIDTSGSTTTT